MPLIVTGLPSMTTTAGSTTSNAVATITSLGTLFSTASEAGKLCIAPMGSGNYSFLNNTGGIRYLCVTYQGRK